MYSQLEVDSLIDGTRVHVTWVGGNSGEYPIAHTDRGVCTIDSHGLIMDYGLLDNVGFSGYSQRVTTTDCQRRGRR